MPGARLLILLALMASVVITWPLWLARESPPLLPLLDLPQVSLGAPLLAACVAALFAPCQGALVVLLLLGYGMATDQTRMQPEFFSLPLLLLGTLPSRSFRLIARTHLITLWFFAGLHKLLSPAYFSEAGLRLLRGDLFPDHPGMLTAAAAGIAILEISTAITALVPASRILSAGLALGLHAGVLISLSPLAEMRNEAVWPWNVVLALSGFAFIAPWKASLRRSLVQVPLATRVAVAGLAIAPLGFYAGIVDAYPAHHLYSGGTASATVYCPAGCRAEQDVNATWRHLRVPLPPQPRLYYQSFARTCSPGDTLRIDDPHPPPWSESGDGRLRYCPGGSLPAAHP